MTLTTRKPVPVTITRPPVYLHIILALVYSLGVQLAASASLQTFVDRAVAQGGENPFRSTETLLVFIRVSAIVFGLVLSAFQAFIYRLVVRLAVPEIALGFRASWFYVLLAQLPFTAIIVGTQLIAPGEVPGLVAGTGFRLLTGVLAVLLYAVPVLRLAGPRRARAAIGLGLILAVNLALGFSLS